MIGEFPGASYDAWKTRSPDDEREEDRFDEEADAESLDAAFDEALSRDEVRDGFHAFGPYVVEVVANDVVDMNTIVLPSRVGWEPTF